MALQSFGRPSYIHLEAAATRKFRNHDLMNAKAIAATLATAIAIFTLTGCGTANAVRTTVDTFDQLECSARKFKGEQLCETESE